ncbi:MAG: class I SAM-dependent methyltransferase [Armatimonadota bacterium]
MNNKTYTHDQLTLAHEALLSAVSPNSTVLDVGCATGIMTRALKQRLACKVTAVDVSDDMIQVAAPYADEVIVGDISRAETRQRLSGPYDCIVFADVLEHLADPWEMLRWARKMLSSGGCVVASIPNVAYYRVRLRLLFGRFEYTRFGILDDTHLRFFTHRTAKRLFIDSGYTVSELARINAGVVRKALARVFPGLFAYQFVLRAELSGSD